MKVETNNNQEDRPLTTGGPVMLGYSTARFKAARDESGMSYHAFHVKVTKESLKFGVVPAPTQTKSWWELDKVPNKYIFPVALAFGKSLNYFFPPASEESLN